MWTGRTMAQCHRSTLSAAYDRIVRGLGLRRPVPPQSSPASGMEGGLDRAIGTQAGRPRCPGRSRPRNCGDTEQADRAGRKYAEALEALRQANRRAQRVIDRQIETVTRDAD